MAKDYKIFGREVAGKERADLYYGAVRAINKHLGFADIESGQTTPTPEPPTPVVEAEYEDVTLKYNDSGSPSGITALYQAAFTSDYKIKENHSYVLTGFIPVQAGEKYVLNGSISPLLPCVVGFNSALPSIDSFDKDDVILGKDILQVITKYKTDDYNHYLTDYIVEIPEGFSYIRVSAHSKNTSLNPDKKELSVKKVIGDITIVVPDGQTDVTRMYDENGAEFAEGYDDDKLYHLFFNPDCSTTGYEKHNMTGYIPVSKGDKYRISGNVNPANPAVVGYKGIGGTAIALVDPSTFDPNIPVSGYSKLDKYTAIFDGYIFEITDDVSHIRYAARTADHNNNQEGREIEIFKIASGSTDEGGSGGEGGGEDPTPTPEEEERLSGDVTFAYDKLGREVVGKTGDTYQVKDKDGNTYEVPEGDVKCLWYLNSDDENLGAIHRSSQDRCYTTGYIPIRNSFGEPLCDYLIYSGFPVLSKQYDFDVCVGFKEIETDSSKNYVELNNRQAFKNSAMLPSNPQDGIRYPVVLKLTGEDKNVNDDINYIRFCSYFVNKPKGKESAEYQSEWKYLQEMTVVATDAASYDNDGNLDFTYFDRPESRKTLRQMAVEDVTQKLTDELDIIDTLQLLKDPVRSYLKNVNYMPSDVTSKVTAYLNYDSKDTDDLDKPNQLDMKEDGVFYLSDLPDVSRYNTYSSERLANFNFIPGKRYYWQKQYRESYIHAIDVVGERRFIYAGSTNNVRDLGGIKCKCGNSIVYDKIFRGAAIEDYGELQALGITAELDLRNTSEVDGYTSPAFITDYNRVPLFVFRNLYTLTSEGKLLVKQAFEFVASCVAAGKKVYMHCQIGCHRVGLMSAIIEGVLGANQSEIGKDYELSTFSGLANTRISDNEYHQAVVSIAVKYNGSWERFLLDCGVSLHTIDEFKKAMLQNPVEGSRYYEVTYAQLKMLRDSGGLVPGAKYRMTDFDSNVYQEGELIGCSSITGDLPARAGYHHYDLLLTATSSNTLDSEAKALHSARDTDGYFANVDLSKWELKYCLDNDKTKYDWATEGGKGVIYYMKDENENELPYDFKNILFIKDGEELYTFNYINPSAHTLTDVTTSVSGNEVEDVSTPYVKKFKVTGIGDSEFATIVSTDTHVNITNVGETAVLINGGKSIAPGETIVHDTTGGNDVLQVSIVSGESAVIVISEIKPYQDIPASNVVVKPYIVGGVQYLNNIIFIVTDEDNAIRDCFFDNNCHNIDVTDSKSVVCKPYCSQNAISGSSFITLCDDANRIVIENLSNVEVAQGCYNISLALDDEVTEPNYIHVAPGVHDYTLHFTTSMMPLDAKGYLIRPYDETVLNS